MTYLEQWTWGVVGEREWVAYLDLVPLSLSLLVMLIAANSTQYTCHRIIETRQHETRQQYCEVPSATKLDFHTTIIIHRFQVFRIKIDCLCLLILVGVL